MAADQDQIPAVSSRRVAFRVGRVPDRLMGSHGSVLGDTPPNIPGRWSRATRTWHITHDPSCFPLGGGYSTTYNLIRRRDGAEIVPGNCRALRRPSRTETKRKARIPLIYAEDDRCCQRASAAVLARVTEAMESAGDR